MGFESDLHPTSGYTPAEEWANSLTHGMGLLLSVAGLVVAVVAASLARDPFLIVATSVYGASLCVLYLASTLYHSVRSLHWKKRFLVMDHAAIYVLIAGTYTPFALGPLRGGVGWTLFGLIWGLALFGVVRECFLQKRGGLQSSLIYLAMGWLVAFFIWPLYQAMTPLGFYLLMGGGAIYSGGVIFYLWKRLPYHHAIWHLFVVGGAVCQFFAVMTLMQP